MSKFSDDIMTKYVFSRFPSSKDVVVDPNVDIEVYRDRIPVREETKIFSKKLDLDPLWMISSGTLVISLPQNNMEKALQKLQNSNITAVCIGKVKEGEGRLLLHEKNKQKLYEKPTSEKDELTKLRRFYPRV